MIQHNQHTKIFLWLLLIFVACLLGSLSVYRTSLTLFGVISIGFIVFLSYLFWKEAVLACMFWLMFAGAIRKWVLPQFSDIVFFFDHAILAGVYIRYSLEKLKNRPKLGSIHPVFIPLGFFFLWGIFCTLNPKLPNILVGILGFIVHFYFIPLIFIIPQIFDKKENLIKLMKIYVFCSIPLLLLGIVQFFSPVNSPINTYVLVDYSGIALVGGRARITSTFSFISGYTTYLNFLLLIIVYLLGLKEQSIKFIIFLYFLLPLALVNLLMTGSRGATAFAVTSIVFYFVLSGAVSLTFFKRFIFRIVIGIVFVAVLIFFTPIGKYALTAFTARATEHEDIVPRIITNYTAPFKFFKIVGLYGFGIGTTYQGAIALGYDRYKLMRVTGGFEEEPGRLLIELGLVGFISIFIIRFFLVKCFCDLHKCLKDEDLKSIALAIILFQLPYASGINNLVFDHTSQLIYWFVNGFLFLLPKLDEQEILNKRLVTK